MCVCVCVCVFFSHIHFYFVVHCGNENGKRQDERLAKQKLHVHHACFCISLFVVVARLRARNFIILRFMQVNKGQRFYSSFPELRDSLFEFNSRKIRQRLTNWMRWNLSDEVWNSAKSLFDLRPGIICISTTISISWHLIVIFTYGIQEINQLEAK